MKQILVISGKGGTGKTTFVAAFASLAKNAILADCDVDAPDLHLILRPDIQQEIPFFAMKTAVIDESVCIKCGKCMDVCRFNAIDKINGNFHIAGIRCEGCAACEFICPVNAIKMNEFEAGKLYVSKTRFGPFVHAKLGIGQEASGKLVTAVKRRAKELAEKENKELILVDGSPGIGCPVIASLTGVDIALIVTEPTVSGIYDLGRIFSVTKQFKIKTVVCINKFDINEKKTAEIEGFCNKNGIDIVGKIPYDPTVTKAMVGAVSIIEFADNKLTGELKRIWDQIFNYTQNINKKLK